MYLHVTQLYSLLGVDSYITTTRRGAAMFQTAALLWACMAMPVNCINEHFLQYMYTGSLWVTSTVSKVLESIFLDKFGSDGREPKGFLASLLAERLLRGNCKQP